MATWFYAYCNDITSPHVFVDRLRPDICYTNSRSFSGVTEIGSTLRGPLTAITITMTTVTMTTIATKITKKNRSRILAIVDLTSVHQATQLQQQRCDDTGLGANQLSCGGPQEVLRRRRWWWCQSIFKGNVSNCTNLLPFLCRRTIRVTSADKRPLVLTACFWFYSWTYQYTAYISL